MPEKVGIIKGAKVTWKGFFDLELIYKKLVEWLKREGYGIPKEDYYIEKQKPNGKQVEIKWTASKKEEDYFELGIEMKFFIIGLQKGEVMQEVGGKLELDKGEIKIEFDSSLTLNADKRWGDKSFSRKIFEKYFFADNIDAQKIEVYKNTMDIMDETKNFLSLYRF